MTLLVCVRSKSAKCCALSLILQKKEPVGDDDSVPADILSNLDALTRDQLTVRTGEGVGLYSRGQKMTTLFFFKFSVVKLIQW